MRKLQQLSQEQSNNFATASLEQCGIHKVTDGLYTSVVLSPTNHPTYLGYEKVDIKNYQFWATYANFSRRVGIPMLSSLIQRVSQNKILEYPEEISSIFTKEQYDNINKYIQDKDPKKMARLPDSNGIPSGLNGFESVCCGIRTEQQEGKEYYIVYASRSPIKAPKRNTPFIHAGQITQVDTYANYLQEISRDKITVYKDYLNNYDDLIMCFWCVINPCNLLATTHMGIFKNPMACLDYANKYPDISMLLHGFAAVCGAKIHGKHLQVNEPTPAMASIMKNTLGANNIYTDNNMHELRKLMATKDVIIPDNITTLDPLINTACGGGANPTIAIELNVLSNCYYQALRQKEILSVFTMFLANKYGEQNNFAALPDNVVKKIVQFSL